LDEGEDCPRSTNQTSRSTGEVLAKNCPVFGFGPDFGQRVGLGGIEESLVLTQNLYK
jgi:hypothetical protein